MTYMVDMNPTIWFTAFREGLRQADEQEGEMQAGKRKVFQPNLKFNGVVTKESSWQDKTAWRDGFMNGFMYVIHDANKGFSWDWDSPDVKWE